MQISRPVYDYLEISSLCGLSISIIRFPHHHLEGVEVIRIHNVYSE
jgi:hypothetical protein